MANINFNDLSPEDKLRVENMKTLVKMYAVLKALPLELRFTNATVQEGTGLVSVDVQIFNTTTQFPPYPPKDISILRAVDKLTVLVYSYRFTEVFSPLRTFGSV